MDKSTTEFDKIENVAAEKRRAQDFDDLQNELSGNSVGRIARFLSPEARALLIEKRNGKQSAAMTALELALLNDPNYAEIYSNAMDSLADYEDATERALGKLEEQMKAAETNLQNTLDRAAVLPDGRKVFRDKDGQVWDQHEAKVDDTVAAPIEWHGSEPSYEAYLEQKQKAQDLRSSIHEVRVYQTDVIGAFREKMTDPDNPISVDDIKAGIADAGARMPKEVQAEMPKTSVEPSVPDAQSFDVGVPDL